MRKLLLFAGVILLLVLVLGSWFFLGSFGYVARFLGRQSQSIVESERDRFLGTWEHLGDLTLYRFISNGTFYMDESKGGMWVVENTNVTLSYDADQLEVTYRYWFSDDAARLVLTDGEGNQIVYLRQ